MISAQNIYSYTFERHNKDGYYSNRYTECIHRHMNSTK